MSQCIHMAGDNPPYTQCPNPQFKTGPLCQDHGCYRCGDVILADTEDWDERLCYNCFNSERVMS